MCYSIPSSGCCKIGKNRYDKRKQNRPRSPACSVRVQPWSKTWVVALLRGIVVNPALKGCTHDERRRPTQLTDHFALISDAELAFLCESLHACENRIGIEMRFCDHIRFETAASPAIVEVRCE